MKKLAFFDIDGTLTSEIDGSILPTTITAIRKARENGHLMLINTGRCFSNIEERFRDIGFDGYICGCGTNIFYEGQELFYKYQNHETTLKLLELARKMDVDILFESRDELCYDTGRTPNNPLAIKHFNKLKKMNHPMRTDFFSSDFICDKFVIWFNYADQISEFRKFSDIDFECIDRGNNFCEFVPHGYSKATGIKFLLDKLEIDINNTFAFGDSNNDLAMLDFIPNSVAMGNASPKSLIDHVSYVTDNASNDGIAKALAHFNFI